MKSIAMDPAFTLSAETPAQVHLVRQEDWESETGSVPEGVAAFARASGFLAKAGQRVIAPDADGRIAHVLYGLGDGADGLAVAGLSAHLPAGDYAIARAPDDYPMSWIAAGWADGAYRFERYICEPAQPPRLLLPADEAGAAMAREAAAARLARDLVNTPAEDMGPDGLQAAMSELAEAHGARLEVTLGDALVPANYPMTHAVGRAADEAPRFMELSWGDENAPELALVGKGVAFDTGGLNLKTGNYMRLMKKDMGGAAHAIALAQMVMEAGLPVRLKLYVPAVENAVAGNSFRPGDVLATRKGLKVEIDNTDAEGRLILSDALTRACEGQPDLLVDFATLTGAARVAVGPDLAPFYTDDEALADALEAGAAASGDPVWRMPLWRPYRAMLSSSIADIANSGGNFAGSVTAAVFLSEFVETTSWIHFDIWAWREGKYGRPQGAAATGLRAAWAMLCERYAK